MGAIASRRPTTLAECWWLWCWKEKSGCSASTWKHLFCCPVDKTFTTFKAGAVSPWPYSVSPTAISFVSFLEKEYFFLGRPVFFLLASVWSCADRRKTAALLEGLLGAVDAGTSTSAFGWNRRRPLCSLSVFNDAQRLLRIFFKTYWCKKKGGCAPRVWIFKSGRLSTLLPRKLFVPCQWRILCALASIVLREKGRTRCLSLRNSLLLKSLLLATQ